MLKLHVTGLCAGNSPEAGEFPAQMASNKENVSIWWHHHAHILPICKIPGIRLMWVQCSVHVLLWCWWLHWYIWLRYNGTWLYSAKFTHSPHVRVRYNWKLYQQELGSPIVVVYGFQESFWICAQPMRDRVSVWRLLSLTALISRMIPGFCRVIRCDWLTQLVIPWWPTKHSPPYFTKCHFKLIFTPSTKGIDRVSMRILWGGQWQW